MTSHTLRTYNGQMVCPKCKVEKPLTSEFWPRNKSTVNGWAWSCKLCHNAAGRAFGNRDDYHYRRRYGITKAQKEQAIKDQDGLCPICGDKLQPEKGTAHVDHCHVTKKFRGVLCSSCNQGLGNFKDSIDHLESAVKYLMGGQ